ncbi:MAG: hypothetical protein M3010_02940 [Candidatus Dormibacteraeota bacterium]|nr:hypothetical protein [Candidatus Dormibacteraeota bacterium]
MATSAVRVALWVECLLPLLFLHRPMALMEVSARRRFLERHFVFDVSTRSELGPLYTTMRFTMHLVYVGYYGDSRSFPATRYVRFSDRPEYPGPPRRLPSCASPHRQRHAAPVAAPM